MNQPAVREENLPAVLEEKIIRLQHALECLPTEFHHTIETMHHFLPGTYMRTVLMKKGDIIVGKRHKLEHVAIVSSGFALVLSAENGREWITAPAIFKSAPGAKRALLIEEDMVWTTIHPNPSNTQDLEALENELIISEVI